MELVDDEYVETMVSLYCRNRSGQTELIQLFTELADMVPVFGHFDCLSTHEVEDYNDSDLGEVLDDIDDKGANDDGNVKASSVGNTSRCIMIHNDLREHMLIINPDATHAFEFSEYPNILHAH
ncbi:hypothetical protein J1N35_034941 [Gossypium stocksii]|uniref:Uncharacterized protein n=1 Tax=Gossypium stocksii TaxID=47602 RepID=A0A9D3UTB2_9ROSI|nr:hypothetical protein J1N35_034941 [Gossypium stocksii]